MTAQFARTPYRGRSGGSTIQEPHAALLIDFDNVTMGIRSDLTKELKNLLNSDIIKGKVAVQRAYADWRRYPQYIVPLAESSVDLIFAPAYGSAKKNATDIRLAIDAVELVFTRPEIGTIILLSGDSDFSSLVLKLKEYGKYVIGVGIRESASDLLVQNCDEYYSYSALTGLTRAGDEAPIVSEDPWELVEMALRQMIENDDVMRSDRLKQVLLEMDPGFDEKALGFQKFNKFLQEAANRGIISLRKQENGQFEVGPPAEGAAEAAAARDAGETRESRSRRGRRGRGRREEREGREGREPRREQLDMIEAPPAEAPAAGSDGEPVGDTAVAAVSGTPADSWSPADAAEPEASMDTAAPPVTVPEEPAASLTPDRPRREERPRRDERPSAGRTGRKATAAETDAATEATEAAAATAESGDGRVAGIGVSYDLLRRAVSDLLRKGGPAVRDSDVKRRMLELQPGWDEASLGFSKFSRFLRTAHDAEVVTVRRGENGIFEVLMGDGGVHVEPEREERGGRRDRGRGRGRDGRDRGESRPPAHDDMVPAAAAATPYRDASAASAGEQADAGAAPGAAQVSTPAPAAARAAAPEAAAAQGSPASTRETQATPPAAAKPADAAPGLGFRRGSRGRPSAGGPPPLLEGQAAAISRPAATAGGSAAADAAPAASAPAAAPEATGRGLDDDRNAEPSPEALDMIEKSVSAQRDGRAAGGEPPSEDADAERPKRGRGTRGRGAKKTAAPAGEAGAAGDAASAASSPVESGSAAQSQPTAATAAQDEGAVAASAPARPAKQPARKEAGMQEARPGGQPARQATGKTALRIDAPALGLPTAPDDIVAYMSTNYKGVGPKTVQTLIDTFGADRIYDALEKQHERVIELMGTARGENLIDSFADDIAARRANAAPDSRSVVTTQATRARPARKGPAKGPGRGAAPAGGRGGRPDGKRGGPRKGGAGGGRGRPAGK